MIPLDTGTDTQVDAPSPSDYLKHAKEANRIAGGLLRLDRPQGEREINGITLKFSLGLSLQAIELAGKSMLNSLGVSPDQIRRDHRAHNLPQLLDAVQEEVLRQGTEVLSPFQDFLCTSIQIEGQEYGTTIGAYLDEHFSSGPSALPRSYFYPDEAVFMAPMPYSVLFEIAKEVITFSESLMLASGAQERSGSS